MTNITFWSVLAHMCGGPVEGKTICKIKVSQDLLSRDVLLMFPSLRRYHHNLRFCNMGVPWDVP